MPGPGLGFNVIAGPEWARVVAALGRANDDLPGDLGDAIEEDAKELANRAKFRVMALPTPRQAGHTGLRRRVARGVHVVKQGTGGVRVQTSMVDPSEGIIPRGLDRPEGWRHPLFGDKNHWYRNPGYDWFISTFSNSGSENMIEKSLHDVLEKAGDRIARAD